MSKKENGSTPETAAPARGFVLSDATEHASVEDAGTIVHLRDEFGEPMFYGPEHEPVQISMAGTYSAIYRKAEKRFTTENTPRFRRERTPLGEVIERRSLFCAASCALWWKGITYDGEKPVPLSVDNVIAVFTAAPWIYAQATEAMEDHASFSKSASRN